MSKFTKTELMFYNFFDWIRDCLDSNSSKCFMEYSEKHPEIKKNKCIKCKFKEECIAFGKQWDKLNKKMDKNPLSFEERNKVNSDTSNWESSYE